MLNPVALIGGGILAYYLISRIKTTFINKLSLQPKNIKFKGINNGIVNLELPIDITNNNDVNIKVRSFFGRINYGAIEVAKVQKSLSFVVDNNSITRIYVDLSLPINQILSDLINQITTNPSGILTNKIILNGILEIEMSGIIIPVNISNYEIQIF